MLSAATGTAKFVSAVQCEYLYNQSAQLAPQWDKGFGRGKTLADRVLSYTTLFLWGHEALA